MSSILHRGATPLSHRAVSMAAGLDQNAWSQFNFLSSGGSFNLSSGFATDTKDQVKQANDLVDLVGSYLPLRRKGSGYVCHCPWHDDTNPSFQINPARQSWACYVCGIRGDVFDFVMRKEGVEFFEAMKILAERVGIPITVSQKKVVKGSPQDKQTLYRAMNWAVERFHTLSLIHI